MTRSKSIVIYRSMNSTLNEAQLPHKGISRLQFPKDFISNAIDIDIYL